MVFINDAAEVLERNGYTLVKDGKVYIVHIWDDLYAVYSEKHLAERHVEDLKRSRQGFPSTLAGIGYHTMELNR